MSKTDFEKHFKQEKGVKWKSGSTIHDSEITGELNELVIKETRRPDGSLRIQQDFSLCPTMAEQHTAHLTDINYLMEKYKPDELAAYIAARDQHRQEIIGHDFASEPSLQDSMNVIYRSKQAFRELPEATQLQFRSHLEFLKFIDNPENAQKMLDLGILTKKQIDSVKIDQPISQTPEPNKSASDKKQDDDVGGGRPK